MVNCTELNVIPQFSGTCWFNAILMSLLYSQNARRVMLKTSKTWDKHNKLFKTLKLILNKNYKNDKIQEFFHKNKPEFLIHNLFTTYNPNLIPYFRQKLSISTTDFGFASTYITKLLSILGVNYLDITYTAQNDIYLNIDRFIKFTMMYRSPGVNGDDLINMLRNNPQDYINDTIARLTNVPDIIVLYHYNLIPYHVRFIESFYDRYHSNFERSFDDYFHTEIDSFKEYKDRITVNGISYILDSCILSNYNVGRGGHVIAGITCNGQRYVYNGWMRKTVDPAMRGATMEDVAIETPCSLMKFDWDLHNNDSFCLNLAACNLDLGIKQDELCFSFNEGKRIPIYVREDIITTKISTTSSLTNNSQDVKHFINDLYDIDTMSLQNVVKVLQERFNYVDIRGKKLKYLRDTLFDKLYEFYTYRPLEKVPIKSPKATMDKVPIESPKATMDKGDPILECDKVNVIPQFTGTSWFNAILMATLYSQNMRKVLLTTSQKWAKDDNFFKVLKLILKKNYKDTSIAEFFNRYRPEFLLYNIVTKFTPELKDVMKHQLTLDIYSIKFRIDYIIKYSKFLGVNCLDITCFKGQNKCIFNFDRYFSYRINKLDNQLLSYLKESDTLFRTKAKDHKTEISNIISSVPDVIILLHSELAPNATILKEDVYRGMNTMYTNIARAFDTKAYEAQFNFDSRHFLEYPDHIVLNGHSYILDSCITSSSDVLERSIAGITCADKKYIYNGWSNRRGRRLTSPCSLMKFDWDLHKDVQFCIDAADCNIKSPTQPGDLCFSFKRGERILLYARTTVPTISISKQSTQSFEPNDIRDMIDDLYDIDKMTEKDIKHILGYNFQIDQDIIEHKAPRELRDMLRNCLYEYYSNQYQ